MNANELRSLQAPLKARYTEAPARAVITLNARGRLGDENVTCKVETGKAMVEAGLHPATGGDGIAACSGDMLLEALVACAGVTMKAVATALGIELRSGTVTAERRPGRPWDARCGERRSSRLPGDPPAIRPGHRCDAGADRHIAEADRALLRHPPDAAQLTAGDGCACRGRSVIDRGTLAPAGAGGWLVVESNLPSAAPS